MVRLGDEYPRWQCHKVVEAFKIRTIIAGSMTETVFLMPSETGLPAREMSRRWVAERKAKAGGYWVRYEDGYESFSPADAFEGGYERV